jgi:hypothetical protein
MPYDARPTDPPEWYQPPEEAERRTHSTHDLRWPSATPSPAMQQVRHVTHDAATSVPPAHGLPVAPPASFVISSPPVKRPATPLINKPASQPLTDPEPSGTPHSGGNGWGIRHLDSTGDRPLDFITPPPVFEPLQSGAIVPARAPRRGAPTRRIAALGVAILALAGVVALALSDLSHGTHTITQPASVGDLSQLADPQLDAAMQTLQQSVLTAGAANVVDGVYGTAGHPQMLLIVVQGSAGGASGPPLGLQSFFNGLSRGAVASGWTLDRAHTSVTNVDGTTFECSPLSAPALEGAKLSTCAWSDNDVAGVVLDLTGQPMPDTLNQAVLARSATEH